MVTLNAEVGGTNIVDVMLMAAAYNIVNPFVGQYVGSGTLMSGALKIGVGAVAHGKAGRFGDIISGALIFGGANDIVAPFVAGIGGGASASSGGSSGW